MDNISLYISKISARVNTFSINENPSDKLYIKEISNPIYQLSDHIITQLTYPNSLKARHNLLKLLSTLLKYAPKEMKPQLEHSTQLAEFLIKFILKHSPTHEGEEAFKLLIHSFNIQTYQPYLTEGFIKLLFESLMLYDDSDLITKQIYILVDINSISSKVFLKIYHDYPNLRQIQELLLEILNKETNMEFICKILICLRDMIDKENKCIFYSSDLQVIIDIILNGLQSTYSDQIKQGMLELLQRISSFNDYFREMYRIDELIELIEEYTDNADQSIQIKSLSQSVLANINHFLQKKLNEAERRVSQ